MQAPILKHMPSKKIEKMGFLMIILSLAHMLHITTLVLYLVQHDFTKLYLTFLDVTSIDIVVFCYEYFPLVLIIFVLNVKQFVDDNVLDNTNKT